MGSHSNISIQVENLSKIYRIGEVGTGTLSQDIERWFAKITGKEDPYLKIGEINNRSVKGKADFVYSLKDINFEIKQGSAVGIIGKNGAGKSTLLKLLSRVTAPSTGKIKLKGRIASLLEVGTGFHPELTGRENIYLNGAILGMRKREIARKLDEIINFSAIERYIDTPVKRYSSGMYVRLAFAVAAHLESEILIVDEVLAVGDIQFQKKCLGKMEEVSRSEGRTILFVSHNLQAVKNFCNIGLYLSDGQLIRHDDINLVIEDYLNSLDVNTTAAEVKQNLLSLSPSDELKILDINLYQNNDAVLNVVHNGKDLEIEIKYELYKRLEGFRVLVDFCDDMGSVIFRTYHDEMNEKKEPFEPGVYISKLNIPSNILAPTVYDIKVLFGIHATRMMPPHNLKFKVSVVATGAYNQAYGGEYSEGKLCLVLPWEIYRA